MLSLVQGKKLVEIARRSVEEKFSILKYKPDKQLKEEFSSPRGCFVTIHKKGELRGCIGYTDAIMPLHEAVSTAAQHAAFNDPRFPPVEKTEILDLTFEVSILTKPKRIDVRNPEEYLQKIKIGRDGLIVKGTFTNGLLLPQVATEYGWDNLNFLRQTCVKAGLRPDDWQDFDKCRVYHFSCQIFGENAPEGEVLQIM